MKQFILSQLARIGIVAAVKKASAAKKPDPKPTVAKAPLTPMSAGGLLKAVMRACNGELMKVTDAPVVPVTPPISPVVQPASKSAKHTMKPAPPRNMADAFDKKAPLSFLERKFISIPDAIAFNPAWANGTDYYDALVNDIDVIQTVLPGQQVKCMDDHGRRMIITGTQLGPVVVFQRYSEGTDTVVFNAKPVITDIRLIRGGTTRLTDTEVEAILGSIDDDSVPNISVRVDAIVNDVVAELRPEEVEHV